MKKLCKIFVAALVFAVLASTLMACEYLEVKKPIEKTFTISFETNGGVEIEDFELTMDTKAESITIPVTTKEGYDFDGWYLDSELTKEANAKNLIKIIEKEEDLPETVYAKWAVVTYEITYNIDGGQIVDVANEYNIENEIVLGTPSKAGYSFEGWFSNAEFEGDAITTIATGTKGNRDFFAKWSPTPYAITYYLSTGLFSEEVMESYTVESDEIVLSEPTRLAYEFVGWYDNADFEGEAITTITAGAIGEKEIFAKWESIAGFYNESYFEDRITLLNTIYEEMFEEPLVFEDVYMTDEEIVENYLGDIIEEGFLQNVIAIIGCDYIDDVFFVMADNASAQDLYVAINEYFEEMNIDMGFSFEIRENIVSAIMMQSNILLNDIIQDNGNYYITKDNDLILLSYKGEESEFTLPEKINGKNVAGIESHAFVNSDIETLTIGSNIEYINYSAIYQCNNLELIQCAFLEKPENWKESWNGTEAFIEWGYGLPEVVYSFEPNGGEPLTSIATVVLSNEPQPLKADWYFAGWYDNVALDGERISFPYYSLTNTTLYADWSETYLGDGTSIELPYIALVNEVYDCSIDEEEQSVYYMFTPQSTDYYTIESTGNWDTYAYLYDAQKEQIDHNDDGGNGGNFRIYRSLIANETYYIKMKLYNRMDTGSFQFSITEGETNDPNFPDVPPTVPDNIATTSDIISMMDQITPVLNTIDSIDGQMFFDIEFEKQYNGNQYIITMKGNIYENSPLDSEVIIEFINYYHDNYATVCLQDGTLYIIQNLTATPVNSKFTLDNQTLSEFLEMTVLTVKSYSADFYDTIANLSLSLNQMKSILDIVLKSSECATYEEYYTHFGKRSMLNINGHNLSDLFVSMVSTLSLSDIHEIPALSLMTNILFCYSSYEEFMYDVNNQIIDYDKIPDIEIYVDNEGMNALSFRLYYEGDFNNDTVESEYFSFGFNISYIDGVNPLVLDSFDFDEFVESEMVLCASVYISNKDGHHTYDLTELIGSDIVINLPFAIITEDLRIDMIFDFSKYALMRGYLDIEVSTLVDIFQHAMYDTETEEQYHIVMLIEDIEKMLAPYATDYDESATYANEQISDLATSVLSDYLGTDYSVSSFIYNTMIYICPLENGLGLDITISDLQGNEIALITIEFDIVPIAEVQ